MKYLRHINESIDKQSIKDCFMDLEDIGLDVYVKFKYNGFDISITRPGKITLRHEIMETLLFAIPYIKEVYNLKVVGMYLEIFDLNYDKRRLYVNSMDNFYKLVVSSYISLDICLREL